MKTAPEFTVSAPVTSTSPSTPNDAVLAMVRLKNLNEPNDGVNNLQLFPDIVTVPADASNNPELAVRSLTTEKLLDVDAPPLIVRSLKTNVPELSIDPVNVIFELEGLYVPVTTKLLFTVTGPCVFVMLPLTFSFPY